MTYNITRRGLDGYTVVKGQTDKETLEVDVSFNEIVFRCNDIGSMVIKFYTPGTYFLEVKSREGGELYSVYRRGAFLFKYQTVFKEAGVELKNSISGNKFYYRDKPVGCLKSADNIMSMEIDDTVPDRVMDIFLSMLIFDHHGSSSFNGS